MKYLLLIALIGLAGCTEEIPRKSYNNMVVVDPNDGKHYIIQYSSTDNGYVVTELNIPLGTPCNTISH